jgi:hypothetical protein
MNNAAEAREKRLQSLLSEDKNPVAMPTPFGYIREETLNDIIKEYEDNKGCDEFFNKARKAAKLADLSAGMEDSGDAVSAKSSYCDTLARQVGGTHYKKGVQPWTIALDWGLDPWSHNVVKYILRFPYKGGIEDLKKIKHYLDYLIENYDEVTEKYYNKED